MVQGIRHLFGFLRHDDAVPRNKHNSEDHMHIPATLAERSYSGLFMMVCPFQYVGFIRKKANLCTCLAHNRLHVTLKMRT